MNPDSVDLIITEPEGIPCVDWFKWCLKLLKPGAFMFVITSQEKCVDGKEPHNIGNPDTLMFDIASPMQKVNSEVMKNQVKAEFDNGFSLVIYGDKYGEKYIFPAMKPYSEETQVDQMLKNGKGGVWFDDCRIPFVNVKDANVNKRTTAKNGWHWYSGKDEKNRKTYSCNKNFLGRFPANLWIRDNRLGDESKYYDLDKWASVAGVKDDILINYIKVLGSRDGDVVYDPFKNEFIETDVTCLGVRKGLERYAAKLERLYNMKIHESCDKFPKMIGEKFEQLKNDIKEKGLLNPIWVYERKIIDGKNRFRALQELNIEPTIENGMLKEWDGNGSLKGFMASLNILRRHLTTSQRAAFALEFLDDYETAAKERQGSRTDLTSGKKLPEVARAKDKAAKDFGTNRQYINDAIKIKEKAPNEFKKIKEGKTTISKAKRTLRNGKSSKPLKAKQEKIGGNYSALLVGLERNGNGIEKTLWRKFDYSNKEEAFNAGIKKLKGYVKGKFDGEIYLSIFAKYDLQEDFLGSYHFSNAIDETIHCQKYEINNKNLELIEETEPVHHVEKILSDIQSHLKYIEGLVDFMDKFLLNQE